MSVFILRNALYSLGYMTIFVYYILIWVATKYDFNNKAITTNCYLIHCQLSVCCLTLCDQPSVNLLTCWHSLYQTPITNTRIEIWKFRPRSGTGSQAIIKAHATRNASVMNTSSYKKRHRNYINNMRVFWEIWHCRILHYSMLKKIFLTPFELY